MHAPTRSLWTGITLYGALVAAVPALTWIAARDDRGSAIASVEVEAEPEVAKKPVRDLAGIWWRYEQGDEGDRVRFYYFHGDGKGLYRYGRIGHTNTHSFDYDVKGDRLEIRFRKNGESHEVRYRLIRGGEKDGRDWLELTDDPREPGATRYYRERPGPIEPHAASPGPLEDADLPPAGFMWIDLQRYATGGMGFALYQFRPAGIDGRGVGWFHRGDFDDWSTESLTYRIHGKKIELRFNLRDEAYTTSFGIKGKGDARTLMLEDDPRDWWHPHAYRFAGKSFGQASAFELLGVLADIDEPQDIGASSPAAGR